MKIKTDVKSFWKGEDVKIQGKKVVGKTAYEIGLIIEGQAKLLCPVDLGYLSASINTQSIDNGTELSQVVPKVKVKKSKSQAHFDFWNEMPEHFQKITKPITDKEVLVGTAVEYGPYIEFGTVKSDAQSFLRPALDLAKGRVLTIGEENGKFYFKNYLRRPL
jgi:hypothetical protein